VHPSIRWIHAPDHDCWERGAALPVSVRFNFFVWHRHEFGTVTETPGDWLDTGTSERDCGAMASRETPTVRRSSAWPLVLRSKSAERRIRTRHRTSVYIGWFVEPPGHALDRQSLHDDGEHDYTVANGKERRPVISGGQSEGERNRDAAA
jgi:hypothetical protein